MTQTCGALTSYCWALTDFATQSEDICFTDGILQSNTFRFIARPSIKFALFYKPTEFWDDDTFGLILKSTERVRIDLKMWLENKERHRAIEFSVQNLILDSDNERCISNVIFQNENEASVLQTIFQRNQTLYVCCEFYDTVGRVASTISHSSAKHHSEFRLSLWSTYEQNEHDTVIKIGSRVFKVYKLLFTSQSDVFERMFSSHFKEGISNEVTINDVDEDTMYAMIEWLYLGQINDTDNIDKLFKAADKYNIRSLKDACIDIMIATLDMKNIWAYLTLAFVHNNYAFRVSLLEFINRMKKADLFKFAQADEWSQIKNENPEVAKEIQEIIYMQLNTG